MNQRTQQTTKEVRRKWKGVDTLQYCLQKTPTCHRDYASAISTFFCTATSPHLWWVRGEQTTALFISLSVCQSQSAAIFLFAAIGVYIWMHKSNHSTDTLYSLYSAALPHHARGVMHVLQVCIWSSVVRWTSQSTNIFTSVCYLSVCLIMLAAHHA